MSHYCKAYSVKVLEAFPGWSEKIDKKPRKQAESASDDEGSPRKISSEDFLYLHDNYVVTDGIFSDKNIIFDNITDEWKEYCVKILKFNIPDFVKNEAPEKTSIKD